MGDLFHSIRTLFSGDRARRDQVRHLLVEAKDDGTKIELQVIGSVQAHAPMFALTLASVDEAEFIVGQPTAEASRELKPGRRFIIGFYRGRERWIGETTCLGRTKVRDERQRILYTHRFSLPEDLRCETPRSEEKASSRYRFQDLDIELSAFELHSPIYGKTVDLGRRKARLKCHNAMNKLHVGQDVFLKTTLPEPVGAIADLARITRLQPIPDSPAFLVEVTFHTPIEKYDDLLERHGTEPGYHKAG